MWRWLPLLLLPACAATTAQFRPTERVLGQTLRGDEQSVYDLEGPGGRAGEAKLWSSELREDHDVAFLDVGFEVENTGELPIRLAVESLRLSGITTRHGDLDPISPARTVGNPEVAPRTVGELGARFVFPKGVHAADVEQYRVEWSTVIGGETYAQLTPFVRDERELASAAPLYPYGPYGAYGPYGPYGPYDPYGPYGGPYVLSPGYGGLWWGFPMALWYGWMGCASWWGCGPAYSYYGGGYYQPYAPPPRSTTGSRPPHRVLRPRSPNPSTPPRSDPGHGAIRPLPMAPVVLPAVAIPSTPTLPSPRPLIPAPPVVGPRPASPSKPAGSGVRHEPETRKLQ